jgi:hypothetical protein
VDRQPVCGFCEGTGLWADQEGGDPDPCPLCEGTGGKAVGARDDATVTESAAAFPRLLAILPRLSPAERQRLYEELHARYDCRIYRS